MKQLWVLVMAVSRAAGGETEPTDTFDSHVKDCPS